MELIQHVLKDFLQIIEMVIEEMEKGLNYPRFQARLQDGLNELGRNICKAVLEAADENLRQKPEERRGWVIVRRDRKSIVSPFGEIVFERTYFKNKKTKEHRYLVDEMAGYTPHMKVDAALKANIVELASERSYRKSGKEVLRHVNGVDVSGQTVYNVFASFGLRRQRIREKEKSG